MIKRAVIVLFVLSLAFSVTINALPNQAKANLQYAMVIEHDVALYSDASCRYVKFYLPYSYFVKIIEVGTDYSRVTYMDDMDNCPRCEGYVKNIYLDFSFDAPENPYPQVTVTAISDEVLFSDLANKKPKEVILSNNKAVYFGNITYEGEKFFYVYAQNQVGYVRENGFSQLELKEHPLAPKKTPLDDTKLTPTSTKDTKTNTSLLSEKSYQPMIIILIVLSALLLLYFILRQSPQKAEHSFYRDEDDF